MSSQQGSDSVVTWLLSGDPAIRWQVMRDLLGSSPPSVEREREKVAQEGWGARLLAFQDPEGTWAGGMYSPKWTSTTYTLLLLRDLGLPAGNEQALKGCELLLERGLDHFRAAGAERDERLVDAIDKLRSKQRPDGCWNLEFRYPTRYWFHMETIRGPSRWNTLRSLRVLTWWERDDPS